MDLKKKFNGRVLKLGHNVNTDLLHPSEFFSLNKDLVKNGFMQGVNRESKTLKNSIIVAGKNFGCGSSRETTAYSFKLNNVKVIIAVSYARIFFRNMINNGIIPVIIPDLYEHARNGHIIEMDFRKNKVCLNRKMQFEIPKFDNYTLSILNRNGMIGYLKSLI